MRARGYIVTAHVKTTAEPSGHIVLTEAGVAVQGSGGETAKTVT